MTMRERTCCFTGHRNISAHEIPVAMQRTEAIVRELVAKGVIYYGVGGAVGYDTLAAQMLFDLREEFPQIRVILVYPFDWFWSQWTADQQALYRRLLPRYNKVVKVSETAHRDAYLRRDRHLVNNSAYCIAYCTRNTGGTAYTLRYAREHGLITYNVGAPDYGL